MDGRAAAAVGRQLSHMCCLVVVVACGWRTVDGRLPSAERRYRWDAWGVCMGVVEVSYDTSWAVLGSAGLCSKRWAGEKGEGCRPMKSRLPTWPDGGGAVDARSPTPVLSCTVWLSICRLCVRSSCLAFLGRSLLRSSGRSEGSPAVNP